MEASILTSVKKAVNVEADDTTFDNDILMHVNSVLSTLTQLGVGADPGFQIEDSAATWDDLLGSDSRLSFVKSYIYLKLRLLFDPPPTSFGIAAMEDLAKEFEYRIYTVVEVDKAS